MYTLNGPWVTVTLTVADSYGLALAAGEGTLSPKNHGAKESEEQTDS